MDIDMTLTTTTTTTTSTTLTNNNNDETESIKLPIKEWVTISSLKSTLPIQSFWHVSNNWSLNPQHTMKSIKRYQIKSKSIKDINNQIKSNIEYHVDTPKQSDNNNNNDNNNDNEKIDKTCIDKECDGHHHDDQHKGKGKGNDGGLDGDSVLPDEFTDKNVSQVVYKRRLLPKLALAEKNQIDEYVTLDINQMTTTFTPVYPNQESITSTFLPFYYPKVLQFRFRYEYENNNLKRKYESLDETKDEEKKQEGEEEKNEIEKTPCTLYFEAQHFEEDHITNPKLAYLETLTKGFLEKMVKWGEAYLTGYKKRVHHDRVVPRDSYMEEYEKLKEKYKSMAVDWRDITGCDPQKYVYEDIALAAYLICVWRQERTETKSEKKQAFVDLGCGNGLLVNLLNQEGHHGIGIDIRERKVWKCYPAEIQTNLIVASVMPKDASYPEYDWLIGNHSDELTPWVPYIASKTVNQRFFLLPCCFFNFSQKFIQNDPKLGQYTTYLNYIQGISTTLGLEVVKDSLRIPSTKNVAFVSSPRSSTMTDEQLNILRQQLLEKAKYKEFVPRKSEAMQYAPQRRYRPGQFNPHLNMIMPPKNKKKGKPKGGNQPSTESSIENQPSIESKDNQPTENQPTENQTNN